MKKTILGGLAVMVMVAGIICADEVIKSTATSAETIIEDTTILKEVYEPKVLIQAKWGNGPGEFGYEKYYTEIRSVRFIKYDTNGDIYILDNINRKIEVYDKNGVHKNTIKLEMVNTIWSAPMKLDTEIV